jgi:phosphoglycolate phosphatase-like HAD superfamily hydrolase
MKDDFLVKPNPFSLHYIISKFNLNPDEVLNNFYNKLKVIMVGDSKDDIVYILILILGIWT